MNGLFRDSQQGMAHPAGDHHVDHRPSKTRLAGSGVGGEGQAAI